MWCGDGLHLNSEFASLHCWEWCRFSDIGFWTVVYYILQNDTENNVYFVAQISLTLLFRVCHHNPLPSQAMPLQSTYITSHWHRKLLPSQAIAITSLCRHKPLPLQSTSVISHFPDKPVTSQASAVNKLCKSQASIITSHCRDKTQWSWKIFMMPELFETATWMCMDEEWVSSGTRANNLSSSV
jgi:hypothetical protein